MTMRAKTVAVSDFKNNCLRLMDEVSRHGVPITVTKRGKPIVRIVPVMPVDQVASLRGSIVHEDESIYSTGEEFEAAK